MSVDPVILSTEKDKSREDMYWLDTEYKGVKRRLNVVASSGEEAKKKAIFTIIWFCGRGVKRA